MTSTKDQAKRRNIYMAKGVSPENKDTKISEFFNISCINILTLRTFNGF